MSSLDTEGKFSSTKTLMWRRISERCVTPISNIFFTRSFTRLSTGLNRVLYCKYIWYHKESCPSTKVYSETEFGLFQPIINIFVVPDNVRDSCEHSCEETECICSWSTSFCPPGLTSTTFRYGLWTAPLPVTEVEVIRLQQCKVFIISFTAFVLTTNITFTSFSALNVSFMVIFAGQLTLCPR